MKLEYIGYLKDGKLFIRNRRILEMELPLNFKEGKDICITFERKFSKRSSPQNRYYFGVCVLMIQQRFEELGTKCSKDDVHYYLRTKFLKQNVLNKDEVFEIPRSTTELTKSEFSEYVEQVKQFAAESLDIVIPDAGERLELI